MTKYIRALLLERCFDSNTTPLIIVDAAEPNYRIVEINAAYERISGRNREFLVGRPLTAALGGRSSFQAFASHLRQRSPGEEVGLFYREDGSSFWCRLVVSPIPDNDGRVAHLALAAIDISARVFAEQTSDFLATHDPVSGLMSPYVFKERLESELVVAINQCRRLFVCYVDIDKFGAVNETHGFEVGDQLIRLLADRIADSVDHNALVCRIAGDEFVIGSIDRTSDTDLLELGQELLRRIREPLMLGPLTLRVTASIGVAGCPDTAASTQELVQQASLAARSSKERGGNHAHVFNARQRAVLKDRLDLGMRLRGAVERNELELAYQPVVSLLRREIVGMEALVRWRHPELGLVLPQRFIPLAEDLGMIAEIGQWVLDRACLQARRWLDCGVGDFVLSVNVSGLQMRGEQLLEDVSRSLDRARLPARYLELELTEAVITGDVNHVASVMRELRKIGVTLSMDDFGIGRSSLGLLQRLPMSRLKIDRSFVSAVPSDVSAARICRAILGLAHEFGCSVVAEGVETALQVGFLERNGCEFGQGNYFSKPISADAVLARLRSPSVARVDTVRSEPHAGTVLLVDDEQNVLRALARLLRRDGYAIYTAGTFQQAFEILGATQIDVVVSDHRMPDGRGTEFLGKVKETHPGTVRMILSGYADLGAVTEAINGGAATRFLTKPWEDDDLRRVIREAVLRARQAAPRQGGVATGPHPDHPQSSMSR